MNPSHYFGRFKKGKESSSEIAKKVAGNPLLLRGRLDYYFEKQPYELGEAFGLLGDNLPQDAGDWGLNLERDLNCVNLWRVFNPEWVIKFGKYTQFYCGKQSQERSHGYKSR